MSHKDVLKQLSPIELDGVFEQDLTVEGNSLDAAQAAAAELLNEIFPDKSVQLLLEWARICGVTLLDSAPLQYIQQSVLQALQAKVMQQLQARGGLSKTYFIAMGAGMGLAITIDELLPFMAGIGRAGDTLYVPEVVFCWRVNVPKVSLYYFRAGQSSAGERLLWWPPPTALEDLFNKLKPAHTYIIFNFG